MKTFSIKTYTNIGLQWYEVVVEADTSRAVPTIEIVWLPDAAIKEAKERIRATLRNVWVDLPQKKIILNLAPSDIRKIGTRFDLPMAVAILLLSYNGHVSHYEQLTKSIFFGELWLDGSVKKVSGLLPSVISAVRRWYKTFFVPADNLFELQYIPYIQIYPIRDFQQIVDYCIREKELSSVQTDMQPLTKISDITNYETDFQDIKGHIVAKRALSIAAAWLHNVILVWPPGSWKTLLSKAMHGILPPLEFEEILEVSQMYSVVWWLDKENPLITRRPFRQVHHTASKISIVGGGQHLRPGEVSLAHKGILFFDELTEFPREVLEVLRQPLEDKVISISRASGTVSYPARVMFVSAMNPCPCWYFKDTEKSCSCSELEIKKYQTKISGPLLDRVDIILEVRREKIDTLLDGLPSTSSQQMQEQVITARQLQKKRFSGTNISSNADITSKHIEKFIPLHQAAKDFLTNASNRLHLSARVVHRVMKLARTIADLEGSEEVDVAHLAEALQYRSQTMFVDG